MSPTSFAFPLPPVSCYFPGDPPPAACRSLGLRHKRSLNPESLYSFLDLSEQHHSLVRTYSGYFASMGEESSRRRRLLSRARRPKPQHEEETSPPLPLDGAAVPESPQRKKGVVFDFIKKSRPPVDPANIRPDLAKDTKPDTAGLDASTITLDQPNSPPINGFEARDRFSYRRGLMHHPYPHVDAPYMLSYDRPSMENDKFSEMLLRRLNPDPSPSFLKFDKEGPKSILDLGCGSGEWAIAAATYWGSARVIGFDLVHPSRLGGDVKLPENLQWKQGNFVKYKLPFPKSMFDLVRIANLSLCIPENRWEHVLREVRRVLSPGGYLELIDDYIHFPYSKNTPQHPTGPQATRPQSRSLSSGFDDTDEEGVSQGTNALDSDDDETEEDFVSTKSRFSTLVEPDPVPPDVPYDPVADWNREAENSKNLEQVFENMLAQKFNILFRPRKKIEDTLQDVFGRYNSDRINDFRLFLAPPADKESDKASVESSESSSSASAGSIRRAKRDFVHWVTAVERDRKDKKDKDRKKGDRSSGESVASFTQVPENISAKAAGRLGINPSSPRHSAHGQSPGIIVNMQTFIPLSPLELEMHACKHIHTLLSSKAAIHEYLDEVSKRTHLSVPEHEIDDILWDYECFRRKRFNWPAEVPEYQLDSPESETPKSASHRHSFDGPRRQRQLEGESSPYKPSKHRQQDLDLLRSIYVYRAQKVDDDFLLLA